LKNLVGRPAVLIRNGREGWNCGGVESLSKRESKKGKEIQDPRKDLKIYSGGNYY